MGFSVYSVLLRHPHVFFLLPVCSGSEFAPPFWKLSAFVCRIEISEILHCLIFTLNVVVFLLLDPPRRLILNNNTQLKVCFGQGVFELIMLIVGTKFFVLVLLFFITFYYSCVFMFVAITWIFSDVLLLSLWLAFCPFC